MTTAVSLTERQREVLEHVARFRVTTVEAVDRLFYGDRTTAGALKLLQRLVDAELLAAPIRLRGQNFYQLTPQGARHLGVSRRAAVEFNSQTLRERYSVLAFCCLQRVRREYLPPAEFAALYPEIADQAGVDSSHQYFFYTRMGGVVRLGQALIDVSADPPRVVRKCRATAFRILRTPVLKEKKDELLLAILTAEETKAEAIRRLLAELGDRLPLATHVVVVPQMNDIPAGALRPAR
jgi:hypothetical protein